MVTTIGDNLNAEKISITNYFPFGIDYGIKIVLIPNYEIKVIYFP